MSDYSRIQSFAEFVNQTEFSDLPENVVEQTKDYILDCIGCTMGGYAVPEGIMISKLGKEFGSGIEGTILANGQKVLDIRQLMK